MSVVVSIEDVGPCRKQLKIEVPAPAVEAETNRVVDEYRRQVKLPGFRKGKVPAKVVRQRYEREIDQEVVDRLLPRYWKQAEAERELDVLTPPRVESVDHTPGSALSFTAVVEVRPQVELGELGGIELPEPDTEPRPEEVDQTLEELRREASDWLTTERAAARGDLVRGTLTRIGDEAETAEPQKVLFEVGDPQVWEELSLAAIGTQAGGKVEFGRREGPDAAEQRFRLVVETVDERQLPELDDELARKVGEFEDLAALRAAVAERLRLGKLHERRVARERALLDELRARHPIALPDGLVQQEVEAMLRAYAEEMGRRGIDVEQAEIDWQSLADRERPTAEKRVHARLLLDAAAEREGIEVGEDEFEGLLARLAQAEKQSTAALRKALDSGGRLAELRARMRREKLLRRLLGEEEEEEEQEQPAGEPPSGAADQEPERG